MHASRNRLLGVVQRRLETMKMRCPEAGNGRPICICNNALRPHMGNAPIATNKVSGQGI